MNTYRKDAIIAGVLWIIGTAAGVLTFPFLGIVDNCIATLLYIICYYSLYIKLKLKPSITPHLFYLQIQTQALKFANQNIE